MLSLNSGGITGAHHEEQRHSPLGKFRRFGGSLPTTGNKTCQILYRTAMGKLRRCYKRLCKEASTLLSPPWMLLSVTMPHGQFGPRSVCSFFWSGKMNQTDLGVPSILCVNENKSELRSGETLFKRIIAAREGLLQQQQDAEVIWFVSL